MTKIDTKYIRESYVTRLISEEPYPIVISHPEVIDLCDAYDEAQKEIERLKDLLREVLEHQCKDEYGDCDICGAGVGAVLKTCMPDACVYASIQKELGEG